MDRDCYNGKTLSFIIDNNYKMSEADPSEKFNAQICAVLNGVHLFPVKHIDIHKGTRSHHDYTVNRKFSGDLVNIWPFLEIPSNCFLLMSGICSQLRRDDYVIMVHHLEKAYCNPLILTEVKSILKLYS